MLQISTLLLSEPCQFSVKSLGFPPGQIIMKRRQICLLIYEKINIYFGYNIQILPAVGSQKLPLNTLLSRPYDDTCGFRHKQESLKHYTFL